MVSRRRGSAAWAADVEWVFGGGADDGQPPPDAHDAADDGIDSDDDAAAAEAVAATATATATATVPLARLSVRETAAAAAAPYVALAAAVTRLATALGWGAAPSAGALAAAAAAHAVAPRVWQSTPPAWGGSPAGMAGTAAWTAASGSSMVGVGEREAPWEPPVPRRALAEARRWAPYAAAAYAANAGEAAALEGRGARLLGARWAAAAGVPAFYVAAVAGGGSMDTPAVATVPVVPDVDGDGDGGYSGGGSDSSDVGRGDGGIASAGAPDVADAPVVVLAIRGTAEWSDIFISATCGVDALPAAVAGAGGGAVVAHAGFLRAASRLVDAVEGLLVRALNAAGGKSGRRPPSPPPPRPPAEAATASSPSASVDMGVTAASAATGVAPASVSTTASSAHQRPPRLVLAAHSLGGAVATLAGLLLRQRQAAGAWGAATAATAAPIDVVAYNPPPCVGALGGAWVSGGGDGAEDAPGCLTLTTVVVGRDVVPRLSLGSLTALARRLAATAHMLSLLSTVARPRVGWLLP
ncbi:hypothetical protein MMPV_002961 [Pyropia vietnamensis]